jgi:hypothetical protein
MERTEEILAIIERCFLEIHINTHVEIDRMTGVSCDETIKMMKARISQELVNKCRPAIENYLENIVFHVK